MSGCTAANPNFDRGAPAGADGPSSSTGLGTTAANDDSVDPPATSGVATTTPATTNVDPTGSFDTGPSEESGLVDTGAEDDGPPPFCEPEDCDGVCIEGECRFPRLVFVSSEPFTGGMGGLEGAHSLCTELAHNAGWDGSFRAWLSTQVSSPSIHMVHGDDPFMRADEVIIADDWEDFTDGELEAPIDLDEWGGPPLQTFICAGREVWTNTTVHGTVATERDCSSWDATTPGTTSEVGDWGTPGLNWSWTENCANVTCSSALPIFCVQQ
ncbi:MAG: hypothetical protein AAF799_41360 [Myxococcota bacterium]